MDKSLLGLACVSACRRQAMTPPRSMHAPCAMVCLHPAAGTRAAASAPRSRRFSTARCARSGASTSSREHNAPCPDNSETSCPNLAAPASSDPRFRTLALHFSRSRTALKVPSDTIRVCSVASARDASTACRQHSYAYAWLCSRRCPLARPPSCPSSLKANSTCLLAR
jgi:hypothetical protein